MDELTFTLSSPITEKEWDMITDVDFDHTNEITFHTKHGKEVNFIKQSHWIPCSERLPEEDGTYIVCLTDGSVFEYDYLTHWAEKWTYVGKEVTAWQPLPEPYKGEQS